MTFDALKFGDALLGPLPWSEGEHWATIARRVAVWSPTLGVSSQTVPGGPRLPGSFLDSNCNQPS